MLSELFRSDPTDISCPTLTGFHLVLSSLFWIGTDRPRSWDPILQSCSHEGLLLCFQSLRCSWSPPSPHGNYKTQLRRSSLTSKNSQAPPALLFLRTCSREPNQGKVPAGARRGATAAETTPKQLVRATPSWHSLPSADWAFIALLSGFFWCNPLIPVLFYLSFHSSSSLVQNSQSLTLRIRKKILKSPVKTLFFKGREKRSSEEQAYHCCGPTDCFTYTLCMIFYPSNFKYALWKNKRFYLLCICKLFSIHGPCSCLVLNSIIRIIKAEYSEILQK